MKDQIKEIERELKDGEIGVLTPHECADRKARLSGEYSFWSGLLEVIEVRKPQDWLRLKGIHKSDKATDMAYSLTEDGQNEIGLRRKLKRIEKLLQGLNTLIRLASDAWKNL